VTQTPLHQLTTLTLLCQLVPAVAMVQPQTTLDLLFNAEQRRHTTTRPPAPPLQARDLAPGGSPETIDTAAMDSPQSTFAEQQANEWQELLLRQLQHLHAAPANAQPQPWDAEVAPGDLLSMFAYTDANSARQAYMLAKAACELCTEEKFARALPLLKEACRLMPSNSALHMELAMAYNAVGKQEHACNVYEKSLALKSDQRPALHNLAYTYKRLGRISEAISCYDSLLRNDPADADAHFGKGLALLSSGNWEDGWPEHGWIWQRQGPVPLWKQRISEPEWDGSDITDKTVLLTWEGGAGDTFQFIRLAQLVKARGAQKVIVAVQPFLKNILSRCPGIDEIIGLSSDNQIPAFDVHASLLSVPRAVNLKPQEVPTAPYIHIDQEVVAEWQNKLASDTNLKVGLCWQSGTAYHTPHLRAAAKMRSMSLADLAPLANMPGVSFYSLQQGATPEELTAFPGINVPEEKRRGFVDTAGIMSALDIIISVDTGVVHLAGALGKDVLLPLPEPADWRWMIDRTDTPWYPTMRLLRQSAGEEGWKSVVERLREALVERATTARP